MPDNARRIFWSRTRRLTFGLLAGWLLVNLGLAWFARDLNAFSVFGFPLGYGLIAQVAMPLYLLLIVVYVRVMERYERDYLDAADAEALAARDAPPDAA